MSDLPPELQPESAETSRRRRQRMWLGVGIPSLMGAALAVALGIPYWIVLIFLALEAIGIFFST